MRPIDADKLKEKLEAHHDFFVNAWGGFSNLPVKDKARVDEITSCIAEVVNAPAIDPESLRPQGEWVFEETYPGVVSLNGYVCSECGQHNGRATNYCPNCGNPMKGGAE